MNPHKAELPVQGCYVITVKPRWKKSATSDDPRAPRPPDTVLPREGPKRVPVTRLMSKVNNGLTSTIR